ncbi:SRPBCC domain-containing protein [Streptomyces sp. SL13]|uniref:SRPBCC domain-containing protein n=1 Tax=Streptantibioticus silvisoli TaxID=2705255 RepID=A0AA90H4H1_9ACTN|nr:SRPBCC domain-containing protein [Streptantibioticus silvisoli]MDI5968002.1 SRPBCC domain-containing protein [Streptantibioticus silvisoli]
MTHEFEVDEEITLDATPEQVWQAIATGPGIDSWFMGRNEIEPREGGRSSLSLLGHTSESTVTAWEPGRRLAYRGDTGPDGTFMAFEYLIEARDGGGTVLRLVHNGLLGDDWEDQYRALSVGDGMYLRKLAVHLRHFTGRTSAWNLFLPGPAMPDPAPVWAAFTEVFGLTGPAVAGSTGRIGLDRAEPADAVVEFAHEPDFLGVRTADSLYMLVHGYRDTVVVERHAFATSAEGAEAGAKAEAVATEAWTGWLNGLAGQGS